jgi:hypothetical protein
MTRAKKPPRDLDAKLDQLAEMVVDDALEPEVGLDARLEALKIAGAYRHASLKAKGKPDESGSNFGKYTQRIKDAEAASEGDDNDE